MQWLTYYTFVVLLSYDFGADLATECSHSVASRMFRSHLCTLTCYRCHLRERIIWLDSKNLLHHSLSSTRAEQKSGSGYAHGQSQNQEADFYTDKDSWGVFSIIWVLNKSFSYILIIKYTYAYFYSMSVMYFL